MATRSERLRRAAPGGEAGKDEIRADQPDLRVLDLRNQIDAVNGEILAALERRGSLVMRLMRLKSRLGIAPVDRERERLMIEGLVSRARGPFLAEDVRRIFRAIVLASRRLARRVGKP